MLRPDTLVLRFLPLDFSFRPLSKVDFIHGVKHECVWVFVSLLYGLLVRLRYQHRACDGETWFMANWAWLWQTSYCEQQLLLVKAALLSGFWGL